MDFDQLKGFYQVARLKSFTKAAGKLYLTQPAISLQVKALEKELGVRLFDRVGRKIALTDAGESLVRLAEEILGKVSEVRVVMDDLSQLRRGRFSLGTSDTTALYFIPALVKEFRGAHPNVEMVIHNRVSQEIVRRVMDCEVDVGIVSLPVEDPRLEVVPLLENSVACVVALDHRFAHRKMIRPRELAGEAFVSLEKSTTTQRRIDAFLSRHGVTPRTVIELGSFEIIKKFVGIGLGISIIPICAVDPRVDGLSVVRFARHAPTLQLGLVHRKERFLPQSAQAFVALARAHFSQRRRGE